MAAARAHLAAGEWTRAKSIAGDLLADVDEEPLRAETLLLLADFEHDDLAVPVLEEALGHAASDQRLEARIAIRLAWAQRFRSGFDGALAAARAALELADGVGDDALRFAALVNVITFASFVGDPEAPSATTRARELAAASGDVRMIRHAELPGSGWFVPAGDLDAEREKLERGYQE